MDYDKLQICDLHCEECLETTLLDTVNTNKEVTFVAKNDLMQLMFIMLVNDGCIPKVVDFASGDNSLYEMHISHFEDEVVFYIDRLYDKDDDAYYGGFGGTCYVYQEDIQQSDLELLNKNYDTTVLFGFEETYDDDYCDDTDCDCNYEGHCMLNDDCECCAEDCEFCGGCNCGDKKSDDTDETTDISITKGADGLYHYSKSDENSTISVSSTDKDYVEKIANNSIEDEIVKYNKYVDDIKKDVIRKIRSQFWF